MIPVIPLACIALHILENTSIDILESGGYACYKDLHGHLRPLEIYGRTKAIKISLIVGGRT